MKILVKLAHITSIFFISLILFPYQCYSAYIGPARIISGNFGNELGQVGYEKGDVPEYDSYPDKFLIDTNGAVILPDRVNCKILVYNPSGELNREFKSKDLTDDWEAKTWPSRQLLLLSDHTIITKPVDSLQKYDLTGNLIKTVQKVSGYLSNALPDGTFLVQDPNTSWHVYSAMLVLQGTFSKQPEIVNVGKLDIVENVERDEEGEIINRTYNATVSYPDGKKYILPSMNMSKTIESFYRDSAGCLLIKFTEINNSASYKYIHSDGSEEIRHPSQSVIQRYNEAGELVDTVILPSDEQDDIYEDWEIIPAARVRYSTEPVFDINGNIYLLSITEEGFSILKWSRQ